MNELATQVAEAAPAPPRSDHIGPFSNDQIATCRAAWIEAGLDPATFDAAVARPAVAPPGSSQAATVAAVAELREAGHDDASIEAILAKHGLTAAQDARTEAEREYDKHWGTPPVPADYKLNLYGKGDVDGAEWQTALSAMGFPVEIGASVAERSIDLAKWYAGASEPERRFWIASERHDLEERYGPDGSALILEKAADTLRNADPAFVEHLKASGVLHARETVMMLAHQGARLTRRAGV